MEKSFIGSVRFRIPTDIIRLNPEPYTLSYIGSVCL